MIEELVAVVFERGCGLLQLSPESLFLEFDDELRQFLVAQPIDQFILCKDNEIVAL